MKANNRITKELIEKLFWQGRKEIHGLGYHMFPLVNSEEIELISYIRSSKALGRCRKEDGECRFEFNECLLELTLEELPYVKDIVYHELSHAIDYPKNAGHNPTWKKITKVINAKCNTNINTLGPVSLAKLLAERKLLPTEEYRYIAKCKKCGQVIRRKRKSDFIKNLEYYSCGHCGGAFEIVKSPQMNK